MALEQQIGSENTTEDLLRNFGDLSRELSHINDSLNRLSDRKIRGRAIEYIFVGISAGIIAGILQATVAGGLAILGFLFLSFWINVIASALKVVRFGWLRSLIIALIISVVYMGLSYLADGYILQRLLLLGQINIALPLWGGIKGMLGGILAAILGRSEIEID